MYLNGMSCIILLTILEKQLFNIEILPIKLFFAYSLITKYDLNSHFLSICSMKKEIFMFSVSPILLSLIVLINECVFGAVEVDE